MSTSTGARVHRSTVDHAPAVMLTTASATDDLRNQAAHGNRRGGRTLLVCDTGGHLSEMWDVRERIRPSTPNVWAVPDHPQSRSLLADEEWVRVPHFGARDWRSAARTLPFAARLLRERGISRVVTTGGSIVTPYMVAAAALRIPRHYIESVARTCGPSLSGRLVSFDPGAHLYTQYQQWEGYRWKYVGSVFDGYSLSSEIQPVPDSFSVLVTLGTNPYPFDRAVRSVQRVLPPGSSVTWQLGPNTDGSSVPNSVDLIPEAELKRLMAKADVVIAHAGAGSALTALECGRQPILIPRMARYGEMVDDHQLLIGEALSRKGLARAVSADDLTVDDIRAASRQRVEQVPAPPLALR